MRVLNSFIVHVTSAFAVDAHVLYPCVRSTQQWRAEALISFALSQSLQIDSNLNTFGGSMDAASVLKIRPCHAQSTIFLSYCLLIGIQTC